MNLMAMLKSLLQYRGFILSNVKREFQLKYSNSMLGMAWAVLNPLAMIIVYTVIFSQVMQSRLAGNSDTFAYGIYLCAGLLTWGLFAEITGRAQNVFLEHAGLIKKISFPRLCLPLIVVLTALLNFLIVFGLFTGFLILSGHFPGWVFVAMAPVLLIQILFAIGLGIVLGVLNVFFRDVGQFFTIFVQFWFWLTPVIYPASILPAAIRPWLVLNPMAPLIMAYQDILLRGLWPNWSPLLPVTLLAVLLCVTGMALFRRRADEMVDEL